MQPNKCSCPVHDCKTTIFSEQENDVCSICEVSCYPYWTLANEEQAEGRMVRDNQEIPYENIPDHLKVSSIPFSVWLEDITFWNTRKS